MEAPIYGLLVVCASEKLVIPWQKTNKVEDCTIFWGYVPGSMCCIPEVLIMRLPDFIS